MYYANANMSEDELAYYMDTLTTALAANVTWTADGQLVNSAGVKWPTAISTTMARWMRMMLRRC